MYSVRFLSKLLLSFGLSFCSIFHFVHLAAARLFILLGHIEFINVSGLDVLVRVWCNAVVVTADGIGLCWVQYEAEKYCYSK